MDNQSKPFLSTPFKAVIIGWLIVAAVVVGAIFFPKIAAIGVISLLLFLCCIMITFLFWMIGEAISDGLF